MKLSVFGRSETHWTLSRMPSSSLPPNLQIIDPRTGKVIGSKPHWDWPWPFSKIPRGVTSFKWGKPKLLLGDQKEVRAGAPAPIGEASSWQVSYYPDAPWWAKLTGLAFYAAYSGSRGEDGKYRHYRLGSRWDDVDSYVTILSAASRKYDGTDAQDTST